MKFGIDIPIEDFFLLDEEGIPNVPDEIKDEITRKVSKHIINQITSTYMDSICDDIVSRIVKSYGDDMAETVIDNVTNIVEKKRAVISETPKKVEIDRVNKEWKDYFMCLVNEVLYGKQKAAALEL